MWQIPGFVSSTKAKNQAVVTVSVQADVKFELINE